VPRPEPIDEKSLLLTFLRGRREHVLGILAGLPDDDLRRPVPRSGGFCPDLVHHLAVVERLRAAGCVFAEEEAELLRAGAAGPAELEAMVGRRVAGEPLEHVLGWAEFRGLRIAVDPGVFVPRRRTEFLVEQAAALAGPGTVVLDLCCGSGALGVALAAERPGIELVAADVDPAAVRCARRNVEPLGGRVVEGDLFAPLPGDLRGRVDVLLANVPYVPTSEIALMPPEARLHEAPVALDGGGDGLDLLRRVAAEAAGWLRPGGSLLTETGGRQAATAAALLSGGGLAARVVTDDEDEATVVIGTRRAGHHGRAD
jgi:release factor glutamine methyltransferase